MVVDSFSNDESFYNQKDILLSILNNKQQIDLLKKEIEEIKVFIKQLIGEHKIEPLLIPKQTSSANLVYSPNVKEGTQTEDEEEIVDNEDFSEVDESPTTLIEMEKKMIISALERANGKRSIAAKELGISERTLYRKINEFEINL